MSRETDEKIQSLRFALFGEFASSLVHEMKGPLSAVILGLDFVAMNLPPGDPKRKTILDAGGSADRLNALMDNLLTYLRPGTEEAVQVKVSGCMEKARSLANYHLSRHRVKFSMTIAGEEPPAPLKPNQLVQALVFLLVNSTRRMPGGGAIDCAIRPEPGTVALSLCDAGPAPEPSAFNGQGADPADGEGLLLLAVQRLLAENRGTLAIRPGENGRTVFDILLKTG